MSSVLGHGFEEELSHLRELRDTVLAVLNDQSLTAEQKLEGIRRMFIGPREEDEAEEEARDQERLS